MYNMLTPEEKSTIWVRKFKNIISSQELNQEQLIFLKSLIGKITPKLFDNSVKDDFNEKEIRYNAIKLFGVFDAKSILSTLNETNLNNEEVLEVVSGPKCGCSRQDSYCGSGSTCQSSSCVVYTSGCGTLWGYSCNGNCRDNSPFYN